MSYYNRNSSSSSSVLPSSRKTHSEKHKQILKQLLKEHANKTCVDCKTATHPRWASWSLGCFICIRCSGIHRSMGTHISKVKSVDLDAWTDEQVELMIKWGNEKCNTYWESKLPEGYVPDALKIENFIRTKYDMKKWVMSPKIPDPMTLKGSNSSSISAQQVEVSDKSKSTASDVPNLIAGAPPASNFVPQGSLLDDDFGSFTSLPSPNPTPVSTSNNGPVMKSPKRNNPLPKLPAQHTNGSNTIQSAQSTGGSATSNTRPDLKKSILSLYSSPYSSSSSFTQPQQKVSTQNNTQASVNSLSTSLSGLDFSSPSTPANTATSSNPSVNSSTLTSRPGQEQQQLAITQASSSTPTWNNEWADLNQPTSNQNSTPNLGNNAANSTSLNSTGLDDDLFKNVWS